MANNDVSTGSGVSQIKFSTSHSSLSAEMKVLERKRVDTLKSSFYIGKINQEIIKNGQRKLVEDDLEIMEYINILRSFVAEKYYSEIKSIYDSLTLFRKLFFELKHAYSDDLYLKTVSQQAIFISKLSEFFQRYASENRINEDFDYSEEVVVGGMTIIHSFNRVLERGIIHCSELMQMHLPQESYETFCTNIINASNNYTK